VAFNDPMPTGVTVSQSGRMFLCHPRWGLPMPATLVELRDGERVPYPNQNWNSPSGDADAGAFVSLQAIVVDAFDRLWAMDTGAPKFQLPYPVDPSLYVSTWPLTRSCRQSHFPLMLRCPPRTSTMCALT
jgi:hypothetical protein